MKTGTMQVTLGADAFLGSVFSTPTTLASLMAVLSLSNDTDLHSFLKPDTSDYIHVPIRALSAAPVQNGIFDFSHKKGAALKAAVPLFNQLTVFKDHNLGVDNWLGKTSGAFWDETTPGVPHGVNLVLDVDTKADPKVARGLISGALDSGSVTIKFDYEQSHPDMKKEDFMWQLGDTVDGQVVRALVTHVQRCMEYSVVWQGADVFAKVIGDDGKIYTPGKASNSLSHQQRQEKHMDYTKLAQMLGLSLGENVTQEAFEAAVKAQNVNVAALAAAKTELAAAQTSLTAAQTQVAELTATVVEMTTKAATQTVQVTTLSARVAELEPQAAIGATALTETRGDALRLYNLVEASKGTDAMRTIINTASLDVARSFITSYQERADQLVPLKCTSCGGTDLSRATAALNTDMPGLTPSNPLADARMNAALASVHGK